MNELQVFLPLAALSTGHHHPRSQMQAPNDERLKDAIAELKEGPRELVDLYNEYACPWQQWGLALEMVEIANYSDAAYVRQLWDVYLRQACPFPADTSPSSLSCLLSVLWSCPEHVPLHPRLLHEGPGQHSAGALAL